MIFADKPTGMTDLLHIEMVYAEPGRIWRQHLQLPAGSTVADALAAFEASCFPESCRPDATALAVYGQLVKTSDALYDFDRIEFLRPLIRDPKDTRRLRAAANPLKKPKTQTKKTG